MNDRSTERQRWISLLVLICWLLPLTRPLQAQTDSPIPLQRMKYNHPGLKVDLGVGLWAWPLPIDYDRDGDIDLVVSCPDVPYKGIYLFENPGQSEGQSGDLPVFKPPVKLGVGTSNLFFSQVDGQPVVMKPGLELTKVFDGDFQTTEKLYPSPRLTNGDQRIRANQWGKVDFDGDGRIDLFAGQGLWGDYGWDDAFDESGQWTRGPLHGHVYILRNQGTNEQPSYDKPMQLKAGDQPVNVFGMPSPNFADFDTDGDLDLLCGDFLDGFTYFQNIGSRQQPQYAAARELSRNGQPIEMPLCMIVVTSIDWNQDGYVDLVVGQEDGRVALLKHRGEFEDGMPLFDEPVFFQQQADEVKFGALVTPVSFDWDGDGDEDLVCGNTAGEIGWIENLDGGNPPKWDKPKLLQVEGKPIQIMAGPNGSIQGPAEAKWGYTTIDVADWDHDGLPDVVANSIWGKIVWYRNIGSRTEPKLAAAQDVQVQWAGTPPKPVWNWWDPEGQALVTQWRTTPLVVDWDEDGLNDLLSLDHQGYLAWFQRKRVDGQLHLMPGQRVFEGGAFDNRQNQVASDQPLLRLNTGEAGKSGRRKLCVVDWDSDGKRDLLVNSVNISLLRQTEAGDGRFTFEDLGPLSDRRLAGHTTSPTTTDWDQDGQRELLVGAEDGFFYHPPVNKPAGTSQNRTKQNVLFIAVDDMRAELGCFGSPWVQSPNLDALARRGMRFTRAYCQQALCNPSRASLMTGLRPDTLGVTDLPTHFRDHNKSIVTLPQRFKQEGYFTQGIGKLFHNWRQDDWKGDAASWSVPQVMHYATHGSDIPMVDGQLPKDQVGVPRTESRDVPDEAYFDGRIANRAIAALREIKDRPFFLGVGFWKPHLPFNAPARYWGMYQTDQVSLPANPTPPSDVPAIALHDSRELLRGFQQPPTDQQIRLLREGYYAAISYVDAQIGKVLDELRRLNLQDETIVVFWSDHGFHLGEHGLWCKTSNFELDARVPLIIAMPEMKQAGQQSDSLVELLDLYPTLLELCGLTEPYPLAGKSLVPVLNDPTARVKSVAMTQHPRPAYPKPGAAIDAMGYSARTDRFRYTEWRHPATSQVLARELYDHRNDSGETENLAEQQAYADVIAKHHELIESVGDVTATRSSTRSTAEATLAD